jgi:hypothetical protein
VPTHHDFKRVLQAGVGQTGEFDQVLLEIGQPEDIAQPQPHQFGLMIPSQPLILVFVFASVPEIVQDLGGGFAASELAAEHEFFDQIRSSDRDFGEELRTVEEQNQQLEPERIGGPGFVEGRPRTVHRNVAVQPGHDAVRDRKAHWPATGCHTRVFVERTQFASNLTTSWLARSDVRGET